MKFIPINQLVSVLYYFKKYLIGLLFLITPLLVSAQDVTLFEQFNGRYDFTAIGNTLNVGPNSCNILTQSSANLTLTANQDLVAARLYWAGSGGTPFDNNPGDYQVTLNGTNVNAERTFLNDDIGIPYFGASADVTAIVLANGNGNYTLSNLDLTDNIGSYCGNGTDFGGWSIVIIYEDEDNLALNQISLFDGFEVVSGGTPDITITLGPLDVASDLLAKIGFLAWEGDAGLNNGENLIINGTQISDPPLNPANNQFNGTNSYTGSSELWNMDLDVYNLEGLVDPGDTEIIIDVGSDQDLVIIHNIITSVNSELPDASIIFEPIEFICNNTVDLNYTVFNVNSTGELPAGVPIKFYLEGTQIAQATTTIPLPINGAETGTVTLTIPTGTVPDPFQILAVVDDDGGGVSTVIETNEDNNEFQQTINLADVTLNVVLDSDILIANGDAICDGADQVIGIDSLTPPGAAGTNSTYKWFFNGAIIPGATNNQLTVTQAGTYELEVTYGGCNVTDAIVVEYITNPVPGTPNPLVVCDEVPNDGEAEFILTDADSDVINGQADTFVTYHETEIQAEAGTDVLSSPYVSSNRTIYARLEENILGCYGIIELDLVVNAAPVTDFVPAEYPLCDNDQNGLENFNFDDFISVPTDITLSYYNSATNANTDTNPITTTTTPSSNAYPSAGAETIWVRVVNLEGCVTVSSFELELLGVAFNPITRFSVCDDSIRDGFAEFDLESQNTDIATIGGVFNPDLTITYHLTETDAEAGTIPSLASPYTNITAFSQSIWVRVEDDITGCYGVFNLLLGVISPIAGTPNPLVLCDEVPNDGTAAFNLVAADADIINGQGFVGVNYFETLAEAQLGNPLDALPIPYNSSTQTIFARLQSTVPGFEDCYDTISLDLIVNPAPAIADPISEYPLCDNDEDGTENFDLTSKNTEIENGLPDITLTYYNSELNADLGDPVNAIPTPTAYPSAGAETIWVRAVNLEDCVTVSSFELIIDRVPTYTEVPLFQVCDDDTPDGLTEFDLDSQNIDIATFAGVFNPDLTVTYHLEQTDAEAGTTPSLSSPYTNIVNPEFIWVRVEDDITGCYGAFQIELNVISPIAGNPTPLVECDEFPNDGAAEFDLSNSTLLGEIINGQADMAVSFHLTLQEAQAGTPVLSNPYNSSTQTIFARLQSTIPGFEDCYDTISLDLVVNPAPAIANPISEYALCDNDENGTEVFDLTSKNTEIENGLPDITLTYFNTEADANLGDPVNAIPTPTAYTSAGAETIWISAVNLEGCTSVGSFELIIDTVPIFTEVPLFQVCDDDTPDGITEFDLESQTPTIVAGDTNLIVTYHLTEADAEAGTTPSLSSPYTNTTNPEPIWVRVEDATTGCYGDFQMILEVITPIAGTDNHLIVCDEVPNDGFAEFTLTDADAGVIDGQTGVVVSYYETEALAALGDPADALSSPYTNIDPVTQIIFARLEEDILGCYDIETIVLHVDPAPSITDPISEYPLCDNDEDGTEIFDLTSKYDEIVNTLSDITLTYFNTEADANLGDPVNAIPTPTAYTSAGAETIWISAVNLEGCTSVGSFELIIDTVPIFTEVPLFQVCDDDTPDGITEFDLESQTPTIVGGRYPT